MSPHSRSPRQNFGTSITLDVGFIMDNVASVRNLRHVQSSGARSLIYVLDPEYRRFPNDIKLYKGDTLVIEVRRGTRPPPPPPPLTATPCTYTTPRNNNTCILTPTLLPTLDPPPRHPSYSYRLSLYRNNHHRHHITNRRHHHSKNAATQRPCHTPPSLTSLTTTTISPSHYRRPFTPVTLHMPLTPLVIINCLTPPLLLNHLPQ